MSGERTRHGKARHRRRRLAGPAVTAVCVTMAISGAAVGVDHFVGPGITNGIIGGPTADHPNGNRSDTISARGLPDPSDRSAGGGRSPIATQSSAPPSLTATPSPALPTSRSETRPPLAPTPSHKASPSPSAKSTGSTYADQVVRLVNQRRSAAGCVVLRIDSRLTQAARAHSTDMATRDYFAHNTPEGVTFVARDEAAGYRQPGGENIAAGQRDPDEVMTAWMNSPGHRANILNCQFRAIGVGVARGSAGLYWTQDFGYF